MSILAPADSVITFAAGEAAFILRPYYVVDFCEQLQCHYYVVDSSGPGIGTDEPAPIPANSFPTSDVY